MGLVECKIIYIVCGGAYSLALNIFVTDILQYCTSNNSDNISVMLS